MRGQGDSGLRVERVSRVESWEPRPGNNGEPGRESDDSGPCDGRTVVVVRDGETVGREKRPPESRTVPLLTYGQTVGVASRESGREGR